MDKGKSNPKAEEETDLSFLPQHSVFLSETG